MVLNSLDKVGVFLRGAVPRGALLCWGGGTAQATS